MPTRLLTRRDFLRGGAATAGGLLLASSLPPFARAADGPADFVLRNGFVWTLDYRVPTASAVAVRDGWIVYVGSDSGVRDHVGPGTEVIDLKGRMAMPGIHDGHVHPMSGGRALTAASLFYAQLSLQEFLDAIAGFLADSAVDEPDGWLRVGQWDAIAMGDLPDRHDLDGLDTARPIIVFSLDGHIALVNSRALEIAGVTGATPDPPDGEIERDAQGDPTGILYDGAIGLVSSVIPPPTVEQNTRSLRAAFRLMGRRGITSYLDAAADPEDLAAVAALSDAGRLTLRPSLALFVSPESLEQPNALVGELEDLRAAHARPDVTVIAAKLFFDGVIEYPTQTAAMINPYRVNTGTEADPHWEPGDSIGPTYFPPEIANPGIAALDAAGWQVHIHAIGDRAVRSALDAIEHARSVNGDLGHRHTLAHIEAIHVDEYARFSQLGALASMQMQWAERDSYTMKRLKPYIGRSRWKRLYAAGSLEAAGARLCGGSDWPVDPLLPFRQIEMAVNRTADEIYRGDDEALNPEQSISLRSSIAMHTLNSAYQLHQEGTTGQIGAGHKADLVVIDRNLFAVHLTEASTTEVLLTMVEGEIVHLSSDLVV
ncbi:MAG: amidohydrolase family protein [Actinomycetota bacterium]